MPIIPFDTLPKIRDSFHTVLHRSIFVLTLKLSLNKCFQAFVFWICLDRMDWSVCDALLMKSVLTVVCKGPYYMNVIANYVQSMYSVVCIYRNGFGSGIQQTGSHAYVRGNGHVDKDIEIYTYLVLCNRCCYHIFIIRLCNFIASIHSVSTVRSAHSRFFFRIPFCASILFARLLLSIFII